MADEDRLALPHDGDALAFGIGVRSTSTEDSASTSFDGFIESISGQPMRSGQHRGARAGDQFQQIALGYIAGHGRRAGWP